MSDSENVPFAHSTPDSEAANERLFEHHQRRLHASTPPLPPAARPPTCRSRLSTAPSDAHSNRRYHSVLSAARHAATRRSVTPNAVPLSRHMTEGEMIALEHMAEREERQHAAHTRAAAEQDRRHTILVDSEIQKEAASLERLVQREEEKVRRVLSCREKRSARMEEAKRRRAAAEEERRRRFEEMRRERETRTAVQDPYKMLSAKQRFNGMRHLERSASAQY